ncbi:hypothetical protein BDM02DRAFT_3109194 [Thelephora ganbajun]|uniref:Uncharacterized protein n=1 Tax=Thelephora ganbajun TaxID=370292 RepID=A0ACB6ZSU7_THEGA|nr:hypothetical protein BDM02DRAFT_3109194 [Thelephora ganbajun]
MFWKNAEPPRLTRLLGLVHQNPRPTAVAECKPLHASEKALGHLKSVPHHTPTCFPLPSPMAVIMPYNTSAIPLQHRHRRTATTVLAGYFDPRPAARDVLTSVLNGVPPYKEVEKDQLSRRDKKKEKRERDRERKRAKAAERLRQKAEKAALSAPQVQPDKYPSTSASQTVETPTPQPLPPKTSLFWRARPTIHIATNQRSTSVTPPPMPSSPPVASPRSTPGPASSVTSHTSSKRPRTPDDDEDLDLDTFKESMRARPPRKKRVAVRKGWKGWVEGSPPPSEKLINLDEVQVLTERKTRSGKSFDGVGLAKEDWI